MNVGFKTARAVTLLDVARAAGVSRATVSNVFNRPEWVSLETRQRVEDTAQQLGFPGPDPKGRLLRAGRVNAIGVVTPHSNSYFFEDPYTRELMHGIAAVCDARGAGLTLIAGASHHAALWTIGSAVVDGLVVHCLQDGHRLVSLARQRRLPFVAIDLDPGEGISSVMVQDRRGACLAAQHLLELGHRRIGMLFPAANLEAEYSWIDPLQPRPAAFKVDRERHLGYSDAFAEKGIGFAHLPMIETSNNRRCAAAGTLALLSRYPETTAMLAMSDIIALGAIDGAKKAGRHVPGELSVVGFDDIAEASMSDPPLTTVRQPTAKKGQRAAHLLLDAAEPRNEVLDVEFIVRNSTAPPPVEGESIE